MLGKIKGLLLVGPLVPAFFVIEHIGPEGFPEAQGCSGSSAVAPPPSVRVERPSTASDATSFEVASDGFFLLRTHYLPIEDPTSVVQVSVNSGGTAVPGTLKRLETTGGDMLGWQADEVLPLGTKLDVKAQTTQGLGADEVTLTVAGAPTVLGVPDFSINAWVDFRMGIGDTVTCPSGGSCSYGTMIQIPGAEQALHAVKVDWQLPPITGFVAWQARLETASGPDMIGLASWQDAFSSEEAPRDLGLLVFPQGTERYCANVIVKDLRTGLELKSEQCFDEPGKSSLIERNYGLAQCSSPPPGLKAEWCEIYPRSSICAEPSDSDPDQTPPLDGLPPNLGNDIVGSPQPMDPLRSDDTEPRAQTSESCRISAPGSLAGSSAALLFALGAVAVRRRRR